MATAVPGLVGMTNARLPYATLDDGTRVPITVVDLIGVAVDGDPIMAVAMADTDTPTGVCVVQCRASELRYQYDAG